MSQKAPHLRKMTAAHRQALFTTVQNRHARTIGPLLQAHQTIAGHERIAMNTHEAVWELLLQGL
jgi:hypothetical protein